MSTLYRLKAYFGMVPPEDMDAYGPAYETGYDPAHDGARDVADDRERGYRHDYDAEPARERTHGGGYPDADPRSRYGHPRTEHRAARTVDDGYEGRLAPVHGALAVDTLSPMLRSPVTELTEPADSASQPLPMSRITTVHPRSYNEARTIGERYRDGIPVIINLTELDDAAAKRLVDFAAGLAFALRGSIDKVTSRVFLLSPAGVDVSAEDRRKLAERGFFGQD